jgi:hypothetical protein
MKTNQETKKRIVTAAALALLLCTRWMFYRLEMEPQINTLIFAAEALFFVLIYVLWLFRAPAALTLAAAALGCAGLCVLHGTYGEYTAPGFFEPAAFLPPFIFLIRQTAYADPKAGKPVAACLSVFEYVCPATLLVLAGIAVSKNANSVTSDFIFTLFLAVLAAAVYALVIRTPIQKQRKKTKNEAELPVRQIRASFVRAIAAILSGGAFLAIDRNFSSAYTLAILWAVDLILLHDAGHPVLTSFAERVLKKELAFLQDESDD